MADLPSPLVQPSWLLQHQGSPELVVLDVRWSLERGAERDSYRAGHVPGARFVDLDRDLADPPGPGGRHPLPDPGRFAAAMRSCGVSRRSRVVAYDQVTGAAARAWWMLRAAGHPDVAVLDGGLAGYLEAGGHLETEEAEPAPGDFRARDFSGWLGADAVATCRDRGTVVLDARARSRYLGEPNQLDPRPGHLPGARSLPWTELYRSGRVRPAAEVRQLLAELGGRERPVVVYCGSGVTSCAVLLALTAAGLDGGALYPGSWSEWAADPQREVSLSPGA